MKTTVTPNQVTIVWYVLSVILLAGALACSVIAITSEDQRDKESARFAATVALLVAVYVKPKD